MCLWLFLWRFCAISLTLACIGNSDTIQSPMNHPIDEETDKSGLVFSDEWGVLGPFAIGTREAAWGADPLESLGGFHRLQYCENDTYRSSLGINGIVSWQKIASKSTNTQAASSAELTVRFPEVDWTGLRSVYGWAALQYQGWARGHIEVSGGLTRKIILYTDNILEIWLNDVRVFGGDFYAFRRAPLVATLSPGRNVIEVRLIREIRSMGGTDPSITVTLEAQLATNKLRILENSAILPDLVNGKLPSAFASVTIRNEGEAWIEICDCDSSQTIWSSCDNVPSGRAELAPGQSRPFSFLIKVGDIESDRITKSVCFRKAGTNSAAETRNFKLQLTPRSISSPHKVTFLHPSGVVSYAILTPPSDIGKRHSPVAFPVLLNLHGAGLEADSHQVRHMLDSVPNLHAWKLFPTGMSPWSGDDWHTWGLADVRAAILAISDWIEAVDWDGPGVLIDRWLVTGHSNGGQGTWYFLTHLPDYIVAAAAVSGYLSIQTYVPYSMWKQAPPLLTAVVQQAMSSFRHELLTENMVGTPIIVQHGSIDDNVPPYHSRLMNSLLGEMGADVDYVELPNQGHWFEGAMATNALQAFYRRYLPNMADARLAPISFSTVFPSTDDMGSRLGIVVDQVESPDEFGRVGVSCSGKTWRLSTTNVHRLHFDFATCQLEPPNTIILDGTEVASLEGSNASVMTSFVKSRDGRWAVEVDGLWKTLQQRHGRQRGALDAILRTLGSFSIRMCSQNTFEVAIQISRNAYQYYHADSTITSCSGQDLSQPGNIITLAIGNDLPPGELETFPINLHPGGIEIRRSGHSSTKIIPLEPGLAALFLRPLKNERLELVVWGSDESGLRRATRLVPTLTGVGQADFIILSRTSGWLGHAGAIAMGFFDFEWEISKGSFVS